MMSVLYNVLGQSMPYWHVRSVRMRGPGEKINWITRMGLWGYEVRTHVHGYLVAALHVHVLRACIDIAPPHPTNWTGTALNSLRCEQYFLQRSSTTE